MPQPENSTTVRSNHVARHAAQAALLRSGLRAVDGLSPALAGRLAERLFTTPRRRAPRPWEEAAFAGGVPLRLRAGGGTLRGVRLGEGPAVLLVHGWSGGGTQLAAFAAPLRAAGCAVVAFDLPAHGDSSGRTTTLPEVSDVVAEVARRVGARAAVGHSLGGAAVALALQRGLALDAAVIVGAPAAAAGIFDAFCGALDLGAALQARLRGRLERRTGVSLSGLDLRAAVAGLRTPALVIHDRADREVPFEDGAAIAAAWPGARLLATGGLGHRRLLRDDAVVEAARAFVVERLRRCGCGRLAAGFAHGAPRCASCLLDLHLAHREERALGARAAG